MLNPSTVPLRPRVLVVDDELAKLDTALGRHAAAPVFLLSSASLCAWSAPKLQKLKTMNLTAVRKASGIPRFSRNATGFL
jgi:hypothetical protein